MNEPRQRQISDADAAKLSNLLRAPDLRHQAFGGYACEDTDALLLQAALAIDSLRKTIAARATEPAAAAEAGSGRPAPAVVPTVPEVGSPLSAPELISVGEVLTTAHRAVELLREEAESRADDLVAQARTNAAAIVAEAEAERSRIAEERASSEAYKKQARAEAARLVREAKKEHDRIVATTSQLRAAAEGLRNEWMTQVTQVMKQLDEATSVVSASAEEPQHGIEGELLARVREEPLTVEPESGPTP